MTLSETGRSFCRGEGEGVGGEADQQTGNRAPRATLQVMMSLFITFVNCFWMPWGGRGAGGSDFKLNMSATLQTNVFCFLLQGVFYTVAPKKHKETQSIPKQHIV